LDGYKKEEWKIYLFREEKEQLTNSRKERNKKKLKVK